MRDLKNTRSKVGLCIASKNLKRELMLSSRRKSASLAEIQKNSPPYLSIEQMPQAGWSETVDASEIDLPTIWAKVEQLSKLER
jgi:hypothetical protein